MAYTLVMPSPPELLAPAGDWDCVRAAIENGADAVYFGLEAGFNARARATNFAVDDLPPLMTMLHRRGLRGYATLNTLVFSDELASFRHLIVAIAEAGVDAVLVQDVGAARLIRAICPDLAIHASTQMTLTSAESIRLAEELGMERVVVARELSLDEIVAIRRQTAMPLEVFVHGALCVAYSGQCLTSESLGGRSANRGQCAQACRLPYDLICDGKEVDLGDQKYLLSPQDLAAYALAPELIAAGVASLKIEGRLKTAEYVANITKHYRTAIDAAVAARPHAFTSDDVEEMELSFSRGFSPGWLQGCDHKMLVPATSSAKRGVKLGTVVAVRRDRVLVDLVAGIKRGDGLVFDCGRPVDDPEGGRVYEVFQRGHSLTEPVSHGEVELTFGQGAIDFNAVQPGQIVWKTDDPHLTARLRKTFESADPRRRTPIDLHVTVATGMPVRIVATVTGGRQCSVESEAPTVAATKHALTEETLHAQLGRPGRWCRTACSESSGTNSSPDWRRWSSTCRHDGSASTRSRNSRRRCGRMQRASSGQPSRPGCTSWCGRSSSFVPWSNSANGAFTPTSPTSGSITRRWPWPTRTPPRSTSPRPGSRSPTNSASFDLCARPGPTACLSATTVA